LDKKRKTGIRRQKKSVDVSGYVPSWGDVEKGQSR